MKIRMNYKDMKRYIIGFIIGIVLATSITTVALSISSKDVSYDNTSSGSEKNNVQEAIDDLYDIANNTLNYEVAQIYKKETNNSFSYTLDNDYRIVILVAERGNSATDFPMKVNGVAQQYFYHIDAYKTVMSYAFNLKAGDIITYPAACAIYGIN